MILGATISKLAEKQTMVELLLYTNTHIYWNTCKQRPKNTMSKLLLYCIQLRHRTVLLRSLALVSSDYLTACRRRGRRWRRLRACLMRRKQSIKSHQHWANCCTTAMICTHCTVKLIRFVIFLQLCSLFPSLVVYRIRSSAAGGITHDGITSHTYEIE